MERAKSNGDGIQLHFKKEVVPLQSPHLFIRGASRGQPHLILLLPKAIKFGGRASSEKLEGGLLSVMLFKDEV